MPVARPRRAPAPEEAPPEPTESATAAEPMVAPDAGPFERAALEEQADLDDEQMAEVDRIVAEMNEELAPFGEELVAMYLSNRQPSARQQVAMEAVVG